MIVVTLFCIGVSATPAQPAQNATATAPPSLAATVIQPRPTGYFVGDVVTQRVLLQSETGAQTYTPVTLPPPGRVSGWLERRRAIIDTDASSRRWLAIDYQFLNAPKAVTAATLPAWQLTVKTNGIHSPIALKVPATSLNVAPLSPPGSPEQVGTRDLRPDRVPPNIAMAPILRTLAVSITGLLLTLVAWSGWVLWRNKRADTTQPFASALRELRTLADGEPRAWQVLHRAFDRAAGRVVQSTTLPVLFERAPQLVPARAQIEQFFAQSNQLFFARRNGHTASAANANASASPGAPIHPRTLCLELRRIEKRHER